MQNYIRDEMKMQKIKQSDMAELLGITQPGFSKALENATFTFEQLIKIFRALNTSEEDKTRLLTL